MAKPLGYNAQTTVRGASIPNNTNARVNELIDHVGAKGFSALVTQLLVQGVAHMDATKGVAVAE